MKKYLSIILSLASIILNTACFFVLNYNLIFAGLALLSIIVLICVLSSFLSNMDLENSMQSKALAVHERVLRIGMTKDDVVSSLGCNPIHKSENSWRYSCTIETEWSNARRSLEINFYNGVVVSFNEKIAIKAN